MLFVFSKWRNLSAEIHFLTQILSENKFEVNLPFMREGVKPDFVGFCWNKPKRM